MKTSDLLHKLPTVAELLETPQIKRLVERVNQSTVATGVRSVLEDVRVEYHRSKAQAQAPSIAELAERIARRVLLGDEPHVRPVINATGMLLEPLLGAPPLAEAALDALVVVGRDYSSLELDPLTGRAASRDEQAAELLAELTGAEAATVVNNLTGGLLLAMAALVKGREVIVSRSQVIVTGSGDRLTDILAASGVVLKEVGAANKTQFSDYESAINSQTGAILLVRSAASTGPSANGSESCAGEVALDELADLAARHQLPLVQLVDRATLLDADKVGLPCCLSLEKLCSDQVDLTIARGEGLVGGPESGLMIGKRETVQQLRVHPLAAAVRADKLTLVALTATLRLYRDPTQAVMQIPILSLLTTSPENLRLRAEHIAPQLAAIPGVTSAAAVARVVSIEDHSNKTHPTWCVQVGLQSGQLTEFAKALRMGRPCVLAHEEGDHVLFDLFSVLPRQDIELISAVQAAVK
jgi:L-seryl-tRNA(Ser) seleniumtransferase